MAKKVPTDFMEKYGVDHDEIWEVRAGGAWAIKHSALERVATEQKISFLPPEVLDSNSMEKYVALLITGQMGDRTEWSIGEAAPHNNKNAYVFAMAEKRGKDRVILKLLNSHGAIYSDSEADEISEGKVATLPKKDSREIYTKMQAEIRDATSRDHLKQWMLANKDRILILPDDWQDILRLQCEEMLADLRQRESA